MKLALDPYMLRTVPLEDLPALVAELGYQYLELSPREDFLPFFVHPRADRARIAALRTAASSAGVEVASILPLYRWSSLDEDCLLYTSPSPRDGLLSRMPSSA